MKFAFLTFIFFLPVFIFAQINKNGIPNIRNYSNEEYGASEQNWCIVKDIRGVMYFGNNFDGVLEFDGVNWRKIKILNGSIVRSLAIDDNGTVFVGANGDFGYLSPDLSGNLQYKSLAQNLDSVKKQFTNVWKTYATKAGILFCTPTGIYKYNYKTIELIPFTEKYCFMSFLIKDKIFVGNYAKGLMIFDKDSLQVVQGGDFFALKNIMSIIPVEDNKLYVGTSNNGIFIFDLNTGSVFQDRVSNETNEIFSNSLLYHGIKSRGLNQIYSTIYDNGILTIDAKGKIINQINVGNGLIDNMVYNLYNNNSNDQLWAALNNGISKIDINSPILHFGELSGINGGVNDIIRFKDVLYVATGNGVYYLKYENEIPKFVQIVGINTTWDLTDFEKSNGDTVLLAGSSLGLFEIYSLDKIKSVEHDIVNLEPASRIYYVYNLYPSKIHKGRLYLGGNKELVSLTNNENTWKVDFEVNEINDEVRSIIEDDDSLLWACSGYSGVFSIHFDGSNRQIKRFDVNDGLPALSTNFAFKINNDIVFATNGGLYGFNKSSNKFENYFNLGNYYSDFKKGVYRMAQNSNGDIWLHLTYDYEKEKGVIVSKKWIERLYKSGDSYMTDSIPFKALPNLNYEVIYNDKDDITWFGNSKGIYSFDLKFNKKYDLPYNTLIRKVIIGDDSIAFLGTYYDKINDSIFIPSITQPKELKLSLDYKNNNITFEFAAPFFDEESATLYSSILEGYKEDYWSKWSNKNERIYTNLNEGDYTFKVKAKNIYGIESEIATFEFTILPPWYRTFWAYILYFILAVIIVYVIIKVYTRRLEMEKIRLEGIVKERTAEVVRQKDDIEKKNSILEVQKLEIERQKDLVTEQKDHIEHIHSELKDSILYAERIQKAILPHGDYAEQILKDFFILFKPKDIVSGDFYFATKVNQYIIFAAADCTGHGVPGAFMSMMGVAFLNEIVNDESVQEAGQALDMLRENIIKSLQQTGKAGEQKDGMDISFCVLNEKTNVLQWAGANNPMYIVRKQKTDSRLIVKKGEETEIVETSLSENDYDLFEVRPDKMPVAIYVKMDNFTNNVIQLEKGDAVYVFTDGFADQFGGEKGKKFMYKPFKKLILSIQDKPMPEQRVELDNAIEEWKSHIDPVINDCFEQIDDICVVGVRIN